MVLAVVGTVVGTNAYLAAQEVEAALQLRSLAIAKSLQMQLERVLQFGIGMEQLTGFEEQCDQVVSGYPGIDFAVVRTLDGKVAYGSQKAPADAAVLMPAQAMPEGEAVVNYEGASGEWHKAVVP